jgi:hypothetical protein
VNRGIFREIIGRRPKEKRFCLQSFSLRIGKHKRGRCRAGITPASPVDMSDYTLGQGIISASIVY